MQTSNKYTEKYIKMITDNTLSKSEYLKHLETIINKIYEDGFEDGHNEAKIDDNEYE